ncbi:MAG: porin family protein [Balneolaceae bacterium]|nr:porin family protein [Balneolaceae bacterium]
MIKPLFRILIIGAFMAMAGDLNAQSVNPPEYDNTGFYGGVSFMIAAWSLEDADIDPDGGAGLGFEIGYNTNPHFGLFVSVDGSSMMPEDGDRYTLSHFDVGLQGTFRDLSNRVKPRVRAAFTGLGASDGNFEFTGRGLSVGGGVQIFLSERLSFNGDLTLGWVNISAESVEGEGFFPEGTASSARIRTGLNYQF